MSVVKSVRGFAPEFGENAFLAETCVVIGDVKMGNDCSVWYHAIVRGDVHKIRIGNRCNIQDGAVVHCTYEKAGTFIGDNVSIGHNAIVHGCRISDNVLVGMGAIIMDNAIVESEVLVAAGSVVLSNSVLRSGYIYAGTPARPIKTLNAENAEFHIHRTAHNYVKYAAWFKQK